VNMWYRLLIASGSSATTLNTELIYDIKRNRWFPMERGTDKDLQFSLLVHDTNGGAYNYGFLNTGYMFRLENGTDFDGEDIVHELKIGDLAFAGLGAETMVSSVRLITVSKTTTTNNVTLTHYPDGSETGTEITLSPARSGYRIAQPINSSQKLLGDPFHSFKLSMTTDDETIGFEPLALVVGYTKTGQD